MHYFDFICQKFDQILLRALSRILKSHSRSYTLYHASNSALTFLYSIATFFQCSGVKFTTFFQYTTIILATYFHPELDTEIPQVPKGACTAATAYPSRLRSISGLDFIYGIIDCCFAHTEKLCNFAYAASAEGKGLGSEILSSLAFVELGHKQLFLSCEYRWRSFRNHFEECWNNLQVTKISPVFKYIYNW